MIPIPDDIRNALSAGEQPLWWGRPRQGLVLRAGDALGIPFSLLWCGFVIFWNAGVWTSNAPIFFRLWGLPFLAVGLYMVIGRFFFEARQRASTFYAVTPDRVLIVSGVFERKVSSLNLKSLTEVSLSERPNGEGTIAFGPQGSSYSIFGRSGSWPGSSSNAGARFDLIADAKRVFSIIRSAQG